MWVNPGEIPGNGIDDDGNGYVDDVYGYDFANDDGDPYDDEGHGTHCAGIIGATHGDGVWGIVRDARLMALKFIASDGTGLGSDALEALEYALSFDVPITSNSWGGGGHSGAFAAALDEVAARQGLFVTAAGNEGANADATYPCAYGSSSVLCVGATDESDELAYFSNYGSRVHLAAPGTNILSAAPRGGYVTLSGTSMATPFVAGAAALLASHGLFSARAAGELLLETVDHVPGLGGLVATSGRLNVAAAMLGSAITVQGPAEIAARSEAVVRLVARTDAELDLVISST